MAYVIVDLETTGLSSYRHRITEIAAAQFDGNKIIKEYHTLINPEVRIPSFITKLTGIDNNMVKDSPKINEVLPDVLKFLGDNVFVAHNATFDHGFLNHNAKTLHNCEIANDLLCTRKLANRLLPELSSKRLGALCEHFDIKNSQAHRAMADVHATAEVFGNFLGMLKERQITEPKDIIRFSKLPKSKINY